MTVMNENVILPNLEKVIRGLSICPPYGQCENEDCPYYENNNCLERLQTDALHLLKAQELPPVKPEKLEERTKKWLDGMTAEERLEEIAAILDDWDGYRTAKGLGGLINEVWAYALYPVKAQQPRVMTIYEIQSFDGAVYVDEPNKPACLKMLYCYEVGQRTYGHGYTFVDSDGDKVFYSAQGFGTKWRCWTARPTDEQRKAVKWDE